MSAPSPANRAWTYAGLAIALFAIPAANLIFKLAGYTRADSEAIVVRELVVLAFVGLLLWIVRAGERLPLSSIGLKRQAIGPAILWTLATFLGFAAAVFACLLLVVIRAGVAEEVFYRGFAIERIEALTGSRAMAASIPLILFAGFHFSQGIAGVIIAFCVGAVATAIYLWKRNLVILIVAHFLTDFIPNVLIPLVAGD